MSTIPSLEATGQAFRLPVPPPSNVHPSLGPGESMHKSLYDARVEYALGEMHSPPAVREFWRWMRTARASTVLATRRKLQDPRAAAVTLAGLWPYFANSPRSHFHEAFQNAILQVTVPYVEDSPVLLNSDQLRMSLERTIAKYCPHSTYHALDCALRLNPTPTAHGASARERTPAREVSMRPKHILATTIIRVVEGLHTHPFFLDYNHLEFTDKAKAVVIGLTNHLASPEDFSVFEPVFDGLEWLAAQYVALTKRADLAETKLEDIITILQREWEAGRDTDLVTQLFVAAGYPPPEPVKGTDTPDDIEKPEPASESLPIG